MNLVDHYDRLVEEWLDDRKEQLGNDINRFSYQVNAALNAPSLANKASLGLGAAIGAGTTLKTYLEIRRELKSEYDRCDTDECREHFRLELVKAKTDALLNGVLTTGLFAGTARLAHGMMSASSPEYRTLATNAATNAQMYLYDKLHKAK